VGHVARIRATDMPTDFGKKLEGIQLSVDLRTLKCYIKMDLTGKGGVLWTVFT
jgi:hypothetical protein